MQQKQQQQRHHFKISNGSVMNWTRFFLCEPFHYYYVFINKMNGKKRCLCSIHDQFKRCECERDVRLIIFFITPWIMQTCAHYYFYPMTICDLMPSMLMRKYAHIYLYLHLALDTIKSSTQFQFNIPHSQRNAIFL